MIDVRPTTGCDLTTNHPRLQLADTTLVSHEVDGACMSAKPLRPPKLLALLTPLQRAPWNRLVPASFAEPPASCLVQTGITEYPMVSSTGKRGVLCQNLGVT